MGIWIGLGEAKELLKLKLFLNGLNILAHIVVAGVFGLGAHGIALGTVFSEIISCFVGFYRLQRFLAATMMFVRLGTCSGPWNASAK